MSDVVSRRVCLTAAFRATSDMWFLDGVKQPAVGFLGLANNHSVPHRGQLSAYLRAMGSRAPALYGGSADEPIPS